MKNKTKHKPSAALLSKDLLVLLFHFISQSAFLAVIKNTPQGAAFLMPPRCRGGQRLPKANQPQTFYSSSNFSIFSASSCASPRLISAGVIAPILTYAFATLARSSSAFARNNSTSSLWRAACNGGNVTVAFGHPLNSPELCPAQQIKSTNFCEFLPIIAICICAMCCHHTSAALMSYRRRPSSYT